MSNLAPVEERRDVAVREGSEATAFVSMIERAATNPDVDIEKMERLYAMHEKMQARQAERAFSNDFAEMQPNLPAIEKRGMSHHGKYARWEDIQDQVLPVTSKYGFSVSHKTHIEENKVVVTCILRHRDGHSDETSLPLPADDSGKKNALQQVASAVSYGKRYTACALLGIRVDGDDDDGNRAAGKPRVSKAGARETYNEMQSQLRECLNIEALQEWDADNRKAGLYDQLPDDWFNSLKEEYDHRKGMFSK